MPEQATARVAAYDWATSVGLMPIGLALAGPAGDTLGLETAMRAGTRARRRRRARLPVGARGQAPAAAGAYHPPPQRCPELSR